MDQTRAVELGRRAMADALSAGLPPTPDIYELFYLVLADAVPALTRDVIDLLDQQGGRLTLGQASELRRRHVDPPDYLEGLNRTSRGMIRHLEQASGTFALAEEETRLFGERVAEAAQAPQDDRPLYERLCHETEAMRTRTGELSRRFEESRREIDRLQKELERLHAEANTDPLTGLANRRALDTYLGRTLHACARQSQPLSLVMADVDHFKRFNDVWGHALGDQVLKLVGECIRRHMPSSALAARYGGEEFCLVLPSCRLSDARAVAEQIRRFMEAKRIRRKQSREEVGSVTLSLGVAQAKPDEPADDLMNRADEALYKAKQTGRNRVISTELLAA